MTATALIVAHGTRSPAGSDTVRRIVEALAAERPDVPVALCFVDVATPSLADALAALPDRDVVVVPLLLSAGYHVRVDIPSAVAGRPGVRVAEHLGPDPLIVDALADRLGTPPPDATVLLAAVPSSRPEAREEVTSAAARLAQRWGRDVGVLTVDQVDGLAAPDAAPLAVASYLLAPGDFLDRLRRAVGTRGVVADPIGAHAALVEVVWTRYDAAIARDPVR